MLSTGLGQAGQGGGSAGAKQPGQRRAQVSGSRRQDGPARAACSVQQANGSVLLQVCSCEGVVGLIFPLPTLQLAQ